MADVLDGVPLFCTRAELETKFGSVGIDVQLLDGPQGGIDGALTQATDLVWFYCQRVAPFEALQANRMVRNWTKAIAAYFASGNGGELHSSSFKEEHDTAIAQLEMVAAQKMGIPGLSVIAGKEDKGGVPVVSALAVDPEMNPSVRVNLPASTGTPAGYPIAGFGPTNFPRRRY